MKPFKLDKKSMREKRSIVMKQKKTHISLGKLLIVDIFSGRPDS
jgi:hypothetical protein